MYAIRSYYADGENAPYRSEHQVHRLDVGVRPVVAGTVATDVTGREDSGVRLVRDDDIRIALVVLEPDVVSRIMLLDQVVLQEQRFDFGVGDHEFEIGDPGHEHLPFRIVCALLLEI